MALLIFKARTADLLPGQYKQLTSQIIKDGGEKLSKTMQHPKDGPRTPKDMYLKINTCLEWANNCAYFLNLEQLYTSRPIEAGIEQPYKLHRVRNIRNANANTKLLLGPWNPSTPWNLGEKGAGHLKEIIVECQDTEGLHNGQNLESNITIVNNLKRIIGSVSQLIGRECATG